MNPSEGIKILIGLLVAAAVLYGCWLLMSMVALPQPLPTLLLLVLFLVLLATICRQMGWWT
jgi:hypothetical protein